VMSPDETRRLLAVTSNLKVRTLLSLGYGCGLLRQRSGQAHSAMAPTGKRAIEKTILRLVGS